MVKPFSFCPIAILSPFVLTVDKYYCFFYCSTAQKPIENRILMYLEHTGYIQVVEAIPTCKHSHPKRTSLTKWQEKKKNYCGLVFSELHSWTVEEAQINQRAMAATDFPAPQNCNYFSSWPE